jgi:hypothetical protein
VGDGGADTVGARVAVAGAVVAGTALAVAVCAGAEGDSVAVAGTTEGVVTLVGGAIVALGGAATFVQAARSTNRVRNGRVRIAVDATAPAKNFPCPLVPNRCRNSAHENLSV